jgi:hypothetical protein
MGVPKASAETSTSAHTITVQMYGVTLRVCCDHPELAGYVACVLPALCRSDCARADLEVTARWITDDLPRDTRLFSDRQRLDGFGKRMQISEDELVWFKTSRDPDLQLRFRRGAGGPAFDVAYSYRPSQKKLARHPNLKYRKFFDLLRYLVFFPLAWHLERTRGWSLIHAAAVAADGRAILVGGPGGSGKTTTSVALMARAGMDLLAENLVFCDGSSIFPVPEPLRLSDEAVALLGEAAKELEPLEVPGSSSKSMFRLRGRVDLKGTPAALFFVPQFSASGFVRRLAPEIACERIAAINRLTLEVNDYYWYSAALDLLWPKPGNAERQLSVLKRLAAATPCYTLGIDRTRGVAPVVDRILECFTDLQTVSKGAVP